MSMVKFTWMFLHQKNNQLKYTRLYLSSSFVILIPEVESRTQGSRPRPRPRTQKNPRQGPRPRTAFPRTEPLEANDSNARGQGQGPRTQAQAFSKKSLQKFFSGDLQFIGVPRNFDWGRPKPQIIWNDVIKFFPKKKFLWDKSIVGWKIWNRYCLFACNQDFAKGDGLN